MITRIYIDNYRCFSNFQLEPGRVNLLIGRNGSGKSSLFDVVTQIVAGVLLGVEIDSVFPASELTKWDGRCEQRFVLEVQLHQAKYLHECQVGHDTRTGRAVLTEERVTRDKKTLFRYEDSVVHLYKNDGTEGTNFPWRGTRSFLSAMEERPENTDLIRLLEYLKGSQILKLNPVNISPTSSEESRKLAPDAANFASWYRHLSQESAGELHALFENLRRAIVGFHSLALVGAGRQGRIRDLVVKFKAEGGDPYEVEFDALSDGQRAIIILYTLLMDVGKREQLLFLDEPENYVGLSEVQPWLAALDDCISDSGQVFIISHHPEVIDFLAAERADIFERQRGGPVQSRTVVFDRGSGLRASEQVSRGLIERE